MKPDYNRAAVLAAETLVKYGIRTAPIDPLPILKQLDNVIVISFADLSEFSGVQRSELMPLFGKNQDAITSAHTEAGGRAYVVAYNSLLPFTMIQRALARELGHIVLAHQENSEENNREAMCFAYHFLCPRPLIHSISATNLRMTVDLLANLTGTFDQALVEMRRIPGTNVHPGLNRFIRSQFMPFILNFFEYYRVVKPKDGSAMVDFGSYMDNYEE